MLRLGSAVMIDGRQMLQQAFIFHLEKQKKEQWEDKRLYQRWCVEKQEDIRAFQFYKSAPKEFVDQGDNNKVQIPKWEEADITLMSKG